MIDKILKYSQFLVILALVAIIFFQTCGKTSNSIITKPDTVFTHTTDTSYHQQPMVIVPQIQPVIIESKTPTVVPQQYQPSTDQTALLKQYQDLVNKFLTENRYKDSIQLKDSTGKDVGIVHLNEMVSENQLKTRNADYTLRFPVITNTNTVTITKPYVPVNQLYIGGGLGASMQYPLNHAELGLLFKNKKDHIYGLKGGILFATPTPTPYVGIQSYWKISFKK